MTFVVTGACINCVYTDCVEVCPMDCFFEGPNFLAIHPDECIDCAMCVAECPVGAICSELEVPDGQKEFISLNAQLSQAAGWKRITARRSPPTDHAQWAAVPDKRALLITDAQEEGRAS